MKSLLKIIIKILVIALILSLVIDYCLVMMRNTEPLFTYKEKGNTKYSLIYKINYDNDIVTFYLFNIKLGEKDLKAPPEWEIVDHTGKECNPVKTYFFTDDAYNYYFDCEQKYYIKVGDVEYTLKNALENNILTISDLEETYIKFNKEAK